MQSLSRFRVLENAAVHVKSDEMQVVGVKRTGFVAAAVADGKGSGGIVHRNIQKRDFKSADPFGDVLVVFQPDFLYGRFPRVTVT